MSKILITGGTGFVGKHLAKHLEKENDVYISSRKIIGKKCIKLNLASLEESRTILNDYKFDKIFHLSAQPSVHISWEKPFETVQGNVNTTLNLIKIISEDLQNTKLVLAGTSEIYKTSDEKMTEENIIDPRSPYTISKLTIDYFVRLMSTFLRLNCTILRLFNHTGPGQSTEFVLSNFANQLAKIKLGKQEPIVKVGDLNVSRDFVDVRDVVKAYDLVSKSNEHGIVYNVCSGNLYNIGELLDILIGTAKIKVKIEIEQSRLRKIDVPFYFGSYEKIYLKYGWEPKIQINQTLEDLYNWWLEELK